MKQQYYYTLIFLFGAQVLLFAQQTLMVQQIDRTDGLSQNSVMAIAQDGDGYIWLATRDGLNKYDGYQFTHFRQDPTKPKSSLPSNDVRSLYFDSLTNQLWIGTAEGVSSYDIYNHQFKNYLTIEAYEQNFLVNSIFKDQAKKLWLCTTRGLILLDEEDGSIEKIDLNDLEANVRAIYQSKNEKTVRWVGTHRGLFIVKEENGQFVAQAAEDYIPSLSFFKRLRIATITEDINGDLWFGTERNGIFQFKRTNNEILKFQHDADDPNSLSHNNIRTVINSPDAKLYIGTLVGLNIYDTKTKQLSPLKLEQKNITKQSLSNNSIRTLFFDQNKSLWLGTYFGGVNYHDPRLNRFQVHRYKADENSINFNVISSFQEDAKGNLWIGTEGGGLNYLDRTTGTYKHYEYQENNRRSLSGNNVKTILQDESGLWVGTFQNGLCFTDDITKGFQRFQYKSLDHSNPNNNNIYSLLRRDNELWIATLGGGLNRMNITEKTFKYYKTDASDSLSIVSNSCRLVFEDQLSNIWIGTEGGLDLVEFVTPDSLIFKHYLKGIKIYSIAQIEKKGIWIGSAGNGLLYFDLESKTYYNPVQEHSLMQGTVYGILAENGQKLWLSTSNGIFTYDIEHKIFNTYSAAYGLEKLEYNFNAYHKDQQGKFYFGSTNGYISFEPKDIESKASDAPLVFTYLDAMGKRVEVGEENALLATDINQSTEITFKYNQANFKIGFAKLDYFNPKNNQYRYQMEDIDQRWITIQGQAEATYTIQRPGTYNFRLKASNSDGIWSEEERNIKFIVRPPWWRSIWAYIAYGSIAIFLIWALRRYYLLQASYRLEQLSKQKQAEINEMKLRFFTNITHEFRTPLTLILSPLEDIIRYYEGQKDELGQLQIIHKNAKRLLQLVNQLLTFRTLESDHIRLRVSEANIVELIQEIFLTFKDKAERHDIHYQFQSSDPEILLWFDRDKIEKVLYNLLSNAFKFTPDRQQISVHIHQKENGVFIEIKDTGIGIKKKDRPHIFQRFYEQPKDALQQGSGIGLSMSKELIELHRGSISVESEYKKGSTFIIQLPYGKTHFKTEDIDLEVLDINKIEHYDTIQPTTFLDTRIVEDNQDGKGHLLIVEDNTEIAQYIYSIFQNQYQTQIAENGKIALKKIQKQLPDLIISDVMMPKMDGITFCQKIKADLATSHVPVLLLTARTASIQELEGLKIGADDYITKPFDPELLRLKVANIITTRKKLHERIAVDQSFNPKEVELAPADQVFLQQVLDLMEANIENTNFDIEQFAQDLALSRSILFKKIKALTNQTPKNLMKEMRLKRAAQLLETKELKVSEVAYQAGFSDPKYFAKCFQKKYGCRPSEYIL